MAVQRVEPYTTQSGDKVLKVILKPTKNFPEGKNFFFTDDNSITRELIESYTWYLYQMRNNIYVLAHTYSQIKLRFHQEYAFRLLNYYPDYIDHISGVCIDNREVNLNKVTNQQNIRNTPTIGYHFDTRHNYFEPYYALDYKPYFRGTYHTEPEALIATFKLREEVYSDYNYNFLEDRRDYIHLLDQECRGTISHEESSYLRVKELIESNPWYAYRYNLFDYCQAHSIVIPDFTLDKQGFMTDINTGKRLCPY